MHAQLDMETMKGEADGFCLLQDDPFVALASSNSAGTAFYVACSSGAVKTWDPAATSLNPLQVRC